MAHGDIPETDDELYRIIDRKAKKAKRAPGPKPWFPGPEVATQDANGRDLGYAGPDGRTLYYRGFPMTLEEWDSR